MFYTGIGSRKVPRDVIYRMETFAAKMALMHSTLRSGGADGSDAAFEAGCDSQQGWKEIYLPWSGFNDNKSDLYDCYTDTHREIAALVYGDRWDSVTSGVRSLMTRNTAQVIGLDVKNPTYSDFVVCWTPDGCESAKTRKRATGGTGQAIELADNLGIPVFNMFNDDFDDKIKNFMNGITLFS